MLRRERWNYFKDRLVDRFGCIVYKVGVNAGFDCPNRDGSKAFGGCAYCSQEGSLSPNQDPKLAIEGQIKKGIAFTEERYGAKKFIVYFQAFTNTYAPNNILRERYDSAFIDDRIVGLSIATRPDCVTPENISLLKEYSEKLDYFTVELGLQSAHQNELAWVNRQESIEDYKRAMTLLNDAGIKVISHIILGFPGESYREMLDTVELAQEYKSFGLKLQMLHVIKKTKLEFIYKKENFKLLEQDEYVEILLKLIAVIHPNVEIHRITGETGKESLVAPAWVRYKTKVFQSFETELEKRDIFQGKSL